MVRWLCSKFDGGDGSAWATKNYCLCLFSICYLAVRVGFEPTEPVKVQRFSRPPDSTTLAPHRADVDNCSHFTIRARPAQPDSRNNQIHGSISDCKDLLGAGRYAGGGTVAASEGNRGRV